MLLIIVPIVSNAIAQNKFISWQLCVVVVVAIDNIVDSLTVNTNEP